MRTKVSDHPSTEAVDRLVELGRILERYEDPRLRPLSESNYRIYLNAQREITTLRRSFAPGARDSLEAGVCACPDPHITTCLHLSNCYEVQQIAKRAAEGRAPEPSDKQKGGELVG